MVYATRVGEKPEATDIFHAKEFLGTISAEDYPDEMDRVLSEQPPPPKQKHFNIRTMKTEQMKSDGLFYEVGESRPPMIKCTEWTENQAIPALYHSGILRRS
ncbi:hypothetical protein BKA65DRAFT_495982 [Rhexocercosporidium sp. MPI-PUGE-AT-0058]|nr:hypothetical protein BKA65DRAFT_495982 [Rhexocercosporidium sp. MPI-PUGE-AT-0058]